MLARCRRTFRCTINHQPDSSATVESPFSTAFTSGSDRSSVPARSVGAWKYTSQQISALAAADTSTIVAITEGGVRASARSRGVVSSSVVI